MRSGGPESPQGRGLQAVTPALHQPAWQGVPRGDVCCWQDTARGGGGTPLRSLS